MHLRIYSFYRFMLDTYAPQQPEQPDYYRIGNIFIYPESREVYHAGKRITLRRKEYELLEFLARNKNKALNRFTLLEYVWNYNNGVDTNTLEVHVASLRRKLKHGLNTDLIQTVHGLGYKLCDGE